MVLYPSSMSPRNKLSCDYSSTVSLVEEIIRKKITRKKAQILIQNPLDH